jgi:type II secretory pathway pseudopilin PulG
MLELIAVLVILATLAAAAVTRFISLDANARNRAIGAGIAELNGREILTWTNIKLSTDWVNDASTFALVDKDLGQEYSWIGTPEVSGGTLTFQQNAGVEINRIGSTETHPGKWLP